MRYMYNYYLYTHNIIIDYRYIIQRYRSQLIITTKNYTRNNGHGFNGTTTQFSNIFVNVSDYSAITHRMEVQIQRRSTGSAPQDIWYRSLRRRSFRVRRPATPNLLRRPAKSNDFKNNLIDHDNYNITCIVSYCFV